MILTFSDDTSAVYDQHRLLPSDATRVRCTAADAVGVHPAVNAPGSTYTASHRVECAVDPGLLQRRRLTTHRLSSTLDGDVSPRHDSSDASRRTAGRQTVAAVPAITGGSTATTPPSRCTVDRYMRRHATARYHDHGATADARTAGRCRAASGTDSEQLRRRPRSPATRRPDRPTSSSARSNHQPHRRIRARRRPRLRSSSTRSAAAVASCSRLAGTTRTRLRPSNHGGDLMPSVSVP